MNRLRPYLTLPIAMRALADAIMVNLGLFAGIAVRFVGYVGLVLLLQSGPVTADDVRRSLLVLAGVYADGAPLLTAISLIVFALSGFYTRGRFYLGRYKVIAILQAVTLSYLIFGFLTYFVPWFTPNPRSALALGWLFTGAALVGTRLWASLWLRFAGLEARLTSEARPAERPPSALVIGGAGYIGSVLCRQLLAQGYHLRVLDLALYGEESIQALLDEPNFEYVRGDSRDIEAVVRAMSNVDVVIHLGEIVGDPATTLDGLLTQEVNVAATRMVAEVAKGARVKRFVYASSCSVYGAGEGVFDEQSALNPVSLYARAKMDAERILLSLNDADFHPVILRLATVYGMSPRPRFDLVVNLLTAKAVTDGEFTVFGGGQWRPFVHVSDVARAIMLALEARQESVKGQVFNVGSDSQNYTITALGELVREGVPESRLVQQDDGGDPRNYRVSFGKIHRQLIFEPQVTVAHGIHEIAEAIRAGQVGHYAARRYSNYRTLNEDNGLEAFAERHINDLYAAPRYSRLAKDASTA